jgi:hypothetical protein
MIGQEFTDVLIAIGTVLSAFATTIAVIVSWKVYKGQRLLSQRQLLIPLWEYMAAVRNLDTKNPATPQILKAANTLELIAICVEGQMVDPAVIKRTFEDVYRSIYKQIAEVEAIPKMFNGGKPLTGAELLEDYPAAMKFYESLRQERMNRGRLDER